MKKKVLVVDDDKLMLDYMKGILEEDYDVLAADNGKNGMSLVLLFEPDLIVLDLVMPHLDGYKFLKILKEKKLTTKVIVMTGVPEDKRDDMDMSNVLEVILKPFKSGDFLNKVRKHIEVQ